MGAPTGKHCSSRGRRAWSRNGTGGGSTFVNGHQFSLEFQVLNQAGAVIATVPVVSYSNANAHPINLSGQVFSVPGFIVGIPAGQSVSFRFRYSVSVNGVGGVGGSSFTYIWRFAQANILFLEPRGS